MPNIEIHGLSGKEGNELRRKIFDLFKDKSYADEMVVTSFQSCVFDMKGFSQPFIRLANSCQQHTDEILEVLKTLNIDIEHLKLEKFIPKKTVKEERKTAEDRRGPISEFVGDIPLANSYFSGDLTKMTKEQLQVRINELAAADPNDEDSDEAFTNRTGEMDAIQAELKRRQQGQKPKS